ncbi:hypothetical protein [Pseudomonas coronafaciens]|uniref:hypothetical protein n=1 Tax=Pseudomonas coronafaciens TaxID=53409 RepID=UPI000EFE2C1A|nr:hypothetical protein [Pseudomonas coronafaciens]RMU97829.1 hypothetical protein ALP20_01811 [Pseudomonas coronafaciens pv. coronafaciens]
MTRIRALRQFSHYHAGNFDQHEERNVDDAIAEALVTMHLAVYVEDDAEAKAKAEADALAKEKAAKK